MMPLLSLAAPDWLQGFRPTHETAIGFALIGLYYLIVWLAVGSDPEQGTIVISYEPPEDLSPATLRYLCKKGIHLSGRLLCLNGFCLMPLRWMRTRSGPGSSQTSQLQMSVPN